MDTNSLITTRLLEMDDLYQRMDRTKDLLYLTPYTLMKLDGKTRMDRAVSVTMNHPAVFANAVINDLLRAKRQIVVEGLTDAQNHQIEAFGEDVFAQADERLVAKFGLASLWAWLCNHVCARSLIGARWVTTVVDGRYQVDCLPVDMRWCPFVLGQWAANITFRSASDIQAEYLKKPGALKSIIEKLSGKDLEVRDFWDTQVNEVWIQGQKVFEQPNPFGAPPFVIVLPATGFMLRDTGYLAHESEDLLFLNRDLYQELNRAASIEQTLGMDVLEPAMEQETEDVESPADPVPKSGQNLKVKRGERHLPVPRGDLNRASLTAREDLQKAVQNGGFNDIDTGNVTQTVSAVWITEQSSIRDKFEEPRLQALALFYQQSHRLLIEQARKAVPGLQTSEVKIGQAGKQRKYVVSEFPDAADYTITYQYMTRSKKQELANLAMAGAARGLLPLRVILKDILMDEDPDGTLREIDIEQARQADPAIGLFEMALRYAEEAENLQGPDAEAKKVQSMMLTERGCAIIKQRGQPPSRPIPAEAGIQSRSPVMLERSEASGGGAALSTAPPSNAGPAAVLPLIH